MFVKLSTWFLILQIELKCPWDFVWGLRPCLCRAFASGEGLCGGLFVESSALPPRSPAVTWAPGTASFSACTRRMRGIREILSCLSFHFHDPDSILNGDFGAVFFKLNLCQKVFALCYTESPEFSKCF